MAKTNELSQDTQAQLQKDSFNYEEWKAGFKFDTPEFLQAEAKRKADQLADIRMEGLEAERQKLHRPSWVHDNHPGQEADEAARDNFNDSK